MTQHTKVVAERRAHIFEMLRSDTGEDTGAPEQTKYLDDATASMLIQQAMRSFAAPPQIDVANQPEAPTTTAGQRRQTDPFLPQSA